MGEEGKAGERMRGRVRAGRSFWELGSWEQLSLLFANPSALYPANLRNFARGIPDHETLLHMP